MTKDKIAEIIIDTLTEYLHEFRTNDYIGEVIEEFDFDDITDDLINKLFIHITEQSK